MNKPVNFELAKLLKEKEYNKPSNYYYNENGYLFRHITFTEKEHDWTISAPTIANVVMWLYEKHEYWCYSYTNGKIWHPCIQHKFGDIAVLSGKIGEFNSPTEAYEAAIKYVLEKLI